MSFSKLRNRLSTLGAPKRTNSTAAPASTADTPSAAATAPAVPPKSPKPAASAKANGSKKSSSNSKVVDGSGVDYDPSVRSLQGLRLPRKQHDLGSCSRHREAKGVAQSGQVACLWRFMGRSELEFFYQNGASHIFPELFAPYREEIPEDERHDMIAAYHKRLTGDSDEARLSAAKKWSYWELGTSKLYVDANFVSVSQYGFYLLSSFLTS
ncbi:proline iminopeptidase [Ceraceosorus bombacis]|uniref:Proline iminopeptidase n=1 Tax=Ceraceosorus bombacis TaxID=401625 RepID=A0A0N7LAS6_9BASI|nr:proline iminopeptidase [Ceraceosorus bombacis]